MDSYRVIPYEVRLRFGEWEEMLGGPRPGEAFPIAHAFWNYARGIAFAASSPLKYSRWPSAAIRPPGAPELT